MKSRQDHQNQGSLTVTEPYNVEEQDAELEEDNADVISEESEAEIDEGGLSESEMVDYGYEPEGESGEDEEEDGEGREEDDMTKDELDELGYADY